jgi:tetratricopeptide (TPR) repeat protein
MALIVDIDSTGVSFGSINEAQLKAGGVSALGTRRRLVALFPSLESALANHRRSAQLAARRRNVRLWSLVIVGLLAVGLILAKLAFSDDVHPDAPETTASGPRSAHVEDLGADHLLDRGSVSDSHGAPLESTGTWTSGFASTAEYDALASGRDKITFVVAHAAPMVARGRLNSGEEIPTACFVLKADANASDEVVLKDSDFADLAEKASAIFPRALADDWEFFWGYLHFEARLRPPESSEPGALLWTVVSGRAGADKLNVTDVVAADAAITHCLDGFSDKRVYVPDSWEQTKVLQRERARLQERGFAAFWTPSSFFAALLRDNVELPRCYKGLGPVVEPASAVARLRTETRCGHVAAKAKELLAGVNGAGTLLHIALAGGPVPPGGALRSWAREIGECRDDAAMYHLLETLPPPVVVNGVFKDEEMEAYERSGVPINPRARDEITVTRGDRASAKRENDRGYERRKADDHLGAIFYYQRAVRLDPSYEYGHYNLACELALTGETRSALNSLRVLSHIGTPLARKFLREASADPDFREIRSLPEFREITSR